MTIATPVAGYRTWAVLGPCLVSPVGLHVWEERVAHATCRIPAEAVLLSGKDLSHTPPHPECTCGIYAYHELEASLIDAVVSANAGRVERNVPMGGCLGVVSAWGRVEPLVDRFRAEHAHVEALALPEVVDDGRLAGCVRAIADGLGVPVVAVGDLPEIAARAGALVPPSLRRAGRARAASPPGRIVAARDRTTPVVGYRTWDVEPSGLLSDIYLWEERVVHATCAMAGVHAAPHPRCQCGIAGFRDLRAAKSFMRQTAVPSGPWYYLDYRVQCAGVITAWGDVVMDDGGFRAAHARVEALACARATQSRWALWPVVKARRRVREAARRLGVPVVSRRRLREIAERARA